MQRTHDDGDAVISNTRRINAFFEHVSSIAPTMHGIQVYLSLSMLISKMCVFEQNIYAHTWHNV